MTRDNVLIGCFDPNTKVVREDSVELTISVLSGRHLHRDGGWSQIYPFPTFLQRGTKRYVNLAKQDTGKARQSS